jgi:hypothetical protein
LQKSRPFI